MTYEDFASAQSFLLWSTFAVALVMGAVVNKTNFCTMGAVSDWVNMGDTGRMRAWVLAIAVGVLGVMGLEAAGLVNVTNTFPPYRQNNFPWLENLLGGALFGIGMVLASGCGNKTLVRIGGGNLKSVMVFLVIAVIAYFMINPFPGSDKTLYSTLFYGWTNPTAVSLTTNQDLGAMLFAENADTGRMVMGAVIGGLLLIWAFKSAEFRSSFDNILGGLVVGLAVLAAWYITSNVMVDADGEIMSLQTYVQDWDLYAPADAVRPAAAGPLASQSFTFINPMGQSLGYATNGFDRTLLTFGIMALAGVVAGSLLWALISRSFRFEWFASVRDFFNHLVGAVLMGFGGVLAMGCTIGQGVTGFSTLAIGSILTFVAIVLGSAVTMKVQYYKMVYESEATFLKAFVTALADLRLLPAGMRKLEAV
ncbi:probable transmembrane protein [Thiobacillus denitrificans ATCC 25259]|uniref:Probable transmembrane protein n=1 Tax=Thiobacillus denitrificans (strain ATCC 25259 / T1) TaxID=292415 RepID=Q3SGT9_THIDA|nr:YeeE/YedE family protein [Thiobacillus denitrificans]AAZ98154.1 probable transmembrane protein [Thiobacillus denitrificans ATCC 25259]